MFQYERIVTELLEENTYILYNEDKECIIIDPGYGFELIDSFILSNNLKPLAILATHAHIDHIASASNFIDKYNIDLYVCENEKLIAENFHRAVDYWGMSDVIKKPNVSHWIKIDQKNLQISNFNFSIIFNPGHSPGSVSFVIEDLVFCGDLIFKGSIGRTDLPLGNPIDMKKSLSFFVNSFEQDCKLLPGHREETTLHEELKYNPFLRDEE
jgi:glyoxylase-like metal-dependent hydrolase (beta-lactamase superfamily II)